MNTPDYLVGIERARKKKMLRTLSKKSGSRKARRHSPLRRMNQCLLPAGIALRLRRAGCKLFS